MKETIMESEWDVTSGNSEWAEVLWEALTNGPRKGILQKHPSQRNSMHIMCDC